MKKRGFTLIELLAVIVVLAIIALIATPIVMNTINEAKKGSTERGANNYIKQVETAIALKRMDGIKISDGEYKINREGNLCLDSECKDLLEIEMSGTKPVGGRIDIKNKEIETTSIIRYENGYVVYYEEESSQYKVLPICKRKEEVTNGNKAEGKYNYGDEYSCDLGDGEEKTFYVLDVNGDNVSLIMNMNIDENGKGTTSENTVAWVSKEDYVEAGGTEEEYGETGNNNRGPITANKYLKNSTKNWIVLDENKITLPSAEQITKASGKTFNASGTSCLLDLPTWLYENLNVNGNAPYGYWTSTTHTSLSSITWIARLGGNICNGYINNYYFGGVRPVITISKSQLG